MYSVKEIFVTLQGEGAHAGRAAVFLRFAGCNLWNGLERDRIHAQCRFCDTDFIGTNGVGGGKFGTALELAAAVKQAWAEKHFEKNAPLDAQISPFPHHVDRLEANKVQGRPYVVCTGGEPLLQLDTNLIHALHEQNFEIAIETNGTLSAPDGIDWICVSPKAGTTLKLTAGHELKLVYPQIDAPPEHYAHLDFTHFFLQPMDGLQIKNNIEDTVRYCLAHPQWRLSLQTHKLIGIP